MTSDKLNITLRKIIVIIISNSLNISNNLRNCHIICTSA